MDVGVVKFVAIVTLYGEYREIELSASIGMKSKKGSINIRFLTKWKGPEVVCIIINNN